MGFYVKIVGNNNALPDRSAYRKALVLQPFNSFRHKEYENGMGKGFHKARREVRDHFGCMPAFRPDALPARNRVPSSPPTPSRI
jgi:hypothetical protein